MNGAQRSRRSCAIVCRCAIVKMRPQWARAACRDLGRSRDCYEFGYGSSPWSVSFSDWGVVRRPLETHSIMTWARTINLIMPSVAGACLCLWSQDLSARPFRLNQVPNGQVNSCVTCHVTAGGPRNSFGSVIEADFLDSGGNVLWGPELAAIDADRDDWSNGAERATI